MRILLVIIGETGLQYHRQWSPHAVMMRKFSDVQISYTRNFDAEPDSELQRHDIVMFIREISATGYTKYVIDRCHKNGCKVIFDIDDYWELPPDHGLFKQATIKGFSSIVQDAIKYSDLITTTTTTLAKYINNKKIKVLPNCLDKLEKQWQPIKTDSEKLRFGWIGGLWHKEDIALLGNSVNLMYARKNHSYQFVLGGYADNPEYNEIARVLSLNGKTTAENLFSTIHGKGFNEYGTIYNGIDVSIVPLRNNRFNNCKSVLKLVEAGQMMKPVICSDVLPYSTFPDDCVYKVSPSDNKKGWFEAFKLFLESDQMRIDYANSLHEFVNENYNAEDWAEERYNTYKELIK
jgi:glycosyltransferase involved in cell wall biosynthesis